ncbi:hypothetical protein H9X85_11010 [Anaerotignum lactatifermentans]|uniref:NEAT domain-containing protein n=1 Tax=Anaerotignum lactatifermentans TaxID=160404 RepID=A0ABS2GDP8_9FIRM|nr:hypothetical protein [Anaerotignum lactatifermentans]MBM6830105.1 hypothetical protein [Anaerotignum lactatifermentans]MBM6878663.1 hypothetical protein [Anaerotignum lactatifermentans]MBM6951728.1 hypothetical protein [Anaerotignum lactatifermentans]
MKRKRIIGMLLAALICLSPVSAFAAETPVTVSSGLNLESWETESTFDSQRTIYGEAKPGTQISVSVSRKNAGGDMVQTQYQDLTVGSLGIFSATIDLALGYNYVTLTAEKSGYELSSDTVTIKRVSQRIKKELQSMIALPGTVY